MPANYSLNFDFGTCSVGPLGRGKKPSRLQQMLGDDPFENSIVEQMSLINKAIFQAPAPSYSKRCVSPRIFFPRRTPHVSSSGYTTGDPERGGEKKSAFLKSFSSPRFRVRQSKSAECRRHRTNVPHTRSRLTKRLFSTPQFVAYPPSPPSRAARTRGPPRIACG